MLAIGSFTRVHFVNAATGKERWNVQAHPANLDSVCVAVSPDGTAIASCGGSDKTWKMWDAASGEERFRVEGHSSGREVKGHISGCICKSVMIFERELLPACTEPGHFGWLGAICFSPCGLRVATGADDRAVLVWDARTGEMELRLLGHSARVFSGVFSPDGARICVGCYDGSVRVSDAKSGAVVGTWGNLPALMPGRVHVPSRPTPVCWSPDGRWLAKGDSSEFGFEVLEAATGNRLFRSEGHTEPVWSIAYSPCGMTIATASMDSTVRIWDADSGDVRLCMQGHDCLDLCTCELDEEGGFREFDDPNCKVEGHRREVRSVCFSPDGRMIVSGSEDQSCKFWNVATGELMWTLETADIVWSVAFGRDWERDQRCVAFSMGHHERLGAGSRVRSLDEGVVRMVLEAVDREERHAGARARDEALDDIYHSPGESSDEDEGDDDTAWAEGEL